MLYFILLPIFYFYCWIDLTMANMLQKDSRNITDITNISITLVGNSCQHAQRIYEFGRGHIRNETGRVPVGLVFPREYTFFELTKNDYSRGIHF